MKKKQQHYVFRAYLKPWTTNDKIFCLREGKVFSSGLMGVAAERFFYEVQDLTPDEIEFLRTYVISKTEPMKGVQEQFISTYLLPRRLQKEALKHGADSEYLSIIEENICNSIEDYHGIIEDNLLRFLRLMLQGNMEFYSDDEEAGQFLFAIAAQYTRTKQVRESALLNFGEETIKGVDTRRVWPVISELVAMSLGMNLYGRKDKHRLVLVDNNSDTPFITGDQPVINIHGVQGIMEVPDRAELFYPLSPTRAMLLVEPETDVPAQVNAITVNNYNVLIAQNSHEQLFSNSEGYLLTFSNVVGTSGRGERLRR